MKSAKRNMIHIMVIYAVLLTGVFLFLYHLQYHAMNRKKIKDVQNEYVVQLNEIKKLYQKNSTQAEEKLDTVMEELRSEKTFLKQDQEKNLIVIYLISLLFVFLLLVCLYLTILKPFDELEEYAKEIAAGNFDVEFSYKRVNMFGKFTWAFDHMRTELINAKKNELSAIENNKTVIATLSHDIKTPIASIRGYAEGLTMNMDTTPERRMRYADVIIKKCDEVAKITNDMFIHSLHDLDHLIIKKEPVELKPVITRTLEEVGIGNDIRVNGEILPAVLKEADEGRIGQVIENILGNAKKYAVGSPIDVVTQILHQGDLEIKELLLKADRIYVLSIRDYGPGISDEDVPFIFEKFYRGKNVKEAPGAGLGLFIVKYVMEKMNGCVRIVNHEQGLEVKLYFPLQ